MYLNCLRKFDQISVDSVKVGSLIPFSSYGMN